MFVKGGEPWNKGKTGVQKRGPSWNKGKKGIYSEETLNKMRKPKSEAHKQKLKETHWDTNGSNNPAWKGGVSKKEGYQAWKCRRRLYRLRGASGSHSLGEWETLKAQYNWTCPCCSKREPTIKLTVDHIISLFNGGSDNIENIQPLCRSCNSKKNTKTIKYERI